MTDLFPDEPECRTEPTPLFEHEPGEPPVDLSDLADDVARVRRLARTTAEQRARSQERVRRALRAGRTPIPMELDT